MTATSVARRLHPWRRLAVRMGLGLGLGAAAILWLADQLSLERQRAQLEELVALSADRTAETVHRAAHDGMLRNDADGVRRIIANIGAQEGIDRVRIYNKEGRVRVSSVPAEEGTIVDKRSDECIACHAAEQPKAGLERGDRIRMLPAAGGGRVLGIITPIYNEPKCTAADIKSYSEMTSQGIRDAVWQAAALSFTDSGTMGELLNLAGTGGVNYNLLAQAVWESLIITYTDENILGGVIVFLTPSLMNFIRYKD